MSIMAAQKLRNPQAGYAIDFVTAVMAPLAREIAEKKIKVVTNAGGVNPQACRDAVLKACEAAGVKLKVAVVLGDDLLPRADELRAAGIREMDTGAELPAEDRQHERLSRRLPDRPRAGRRRRRGDHRPLRRFGGDAGRADPRLRLDAGRSRPARRRHAVRPHHRMRRAVQRRQLHRLAAGAGLRQHGLSHRRGVERRRLRALQARRHRRADHAPPRWPSRCSTRSAIRAPTCVPDVVCDFTAGDATSRSARTACACRAPGAGRRPTPTRSRPPVPTATSSARSSCWAAARRRRRAGIAPRRSSRRRAACSREQGHGRLSATSASR